MLGPLQAVTEDGSALRLRLALDACDSGSQDAINTRRSDLEAIVRMVVAGHGRVELEGAEGIERLRAALRQGLGEHLQRVGARAVRNVAIDQFVLRRI
jgi:flagellar basal body-associated protein FliL